MSLAELDTGQVKRCTVCGETKVRAEFHRDRSRKDGFSQRCRDCQRTRNLKFRERQPEYAPQWRAANPGYSRDWFRHRPLYHRLYQGVKRASARGCRIDDFSEDDLLAYWAANGVSDEMCFYTGVPLAEGWHIDHKVPLSRGGAHSMDNIVPCSPEVNIQKGTMTAEEYLAYLTEVSGVA